MIEALKPYPEYDACELPWAKKLPTSWRCVRAKGAFSLIDIRSTTGLQELLTVSSSDGIRLRSQKAVTMFKAKSYIGHKLCWPGDLVVNSLWAWMQGLGVTQHHGLVSSAYSVYRPRKEYASSSRYLHYLLRSDVYKWELLVRSKGVWISRLQLSDTSFFDMPILVPPPEEQAAIVRFLDWANAGLERTIRAKRKIIALLYEQKQAIIHRAVTLGLDPNVPLKPSGVPWLGDIPGSWNVLRAKFLFKEIDDRSVTGSEELLSVSHITGVTPRSQKNITMFKAESYSGHKLCRSGDLVINTMWAWMGALGTASQTGIVSPAYAVYRQRKAGLLKPLYIDSLLRTRLYIDEFMRRSTGIRSSRLRLYPEEFFKIEILVPPLAEQEEILQSISKQTGNLKKSIEKVSAEIDLMREYRTRLIADVVTGKLDVRDAAAKLPVEEVIAPIEDDPMAEENALEDELTEPVA